MIFPLCWVTCNCLLSFLEWSVQGMLDMGKIAKSTTRFALHMTNGTALFQLLAHHELLLELLIGIACR